MRSKLEEEHGQTDGRKWPTNLGWRRGGYYYGNGTGHTAWCSEISPLTSLDACNSGASSDVKEPVSLHQAVLGLLRRFAYEMILADHEHFKTLAWLCMMARWHHWRHSRSHVPFLSLAAWPSSRSYFGPSPSNSMEQTYQIRAYDFGVQICFLENQQAWPQRTSPSTMLLTYKSSNSTILYPVQFMMITTYKKPTFSSVPCVLIISVTVTKWLCIVYGIRHITRLFFFYSSPDSSHTLWWWIVEYSGGETSTLEFLPKTKLSGLNSWP